MDKVDKCHRVETIIPTILTNINKDRSIIWDRAINRIINLM